jgi:GNAT superfamily N-acetyltransferase
VLVEAVPITDPVCEELLRRYVGEIEQRLAAGFDPSRASPPAERDFEPPSGVFVIGRVQGRPVACGGMRTLEPGVGEVRRMYVDPSARGHGVGGAILGALEDAARQMGHTIMRLDTASELHESHRLYESAGYAAVPSYNDNEFAARWYEKRLA